MSSTALFFLAIGLAMDAFAVSICRGLALKKATIGHSIEAGLYFGGFQGLMPLVGYFIGYRFTHWITQYDHWIAFILLGIIGGNMIKSAFSQEEENTQQSMLTLAIATSIDALAVGISLAFLQINIWSAALFIGTITFILSAMGVQIGGKFGDRFGKKAEFFGGLLLMAIGLKILLEHTIFI